MQYPRVCSLSPQFILLKGRIRQSFIGLSDAPKYEINWTENDDVIGSFIPEILTFKEFSKYAQHVLDTLWTLFERQYIDDLFVSVFYANTQKKQLSTLFFYFRHVFPAVYQRHQYILHAFTVHQPLRKTTITTGKIHIIKGIVHKHSYKAHLEKLLWLK